MSRNYGLGTRDMASAGRLALNAMCEQGELSYSTATTYGDRWQQFARYAKCQGIGRMERVTGDLVREYGRELGDEVRDDYKSAAYAQDLVSAVNSIMSVVTDGEWKSVKPVKDCDIPKRCAIRENAPTTIDRGVYVAALQSIRESQGDRAAAVAGLCRELGLRAKEASLIDARAAYEQSMRTGQVTIRSGTKGGRDREIRDVSERQIEALRVAAAVQGPDRSMIPASQTWKQWSGGELRKIREGMKAATGDTIRDLRSAYACERYLEITGCEAPCTGTSIVDREEDKKARIKITSEMGHGRIDVVAEYIGGRR